VDLEVEHLSRDIALRAIAIARRDVSGAAAIDLRLGVSSGSGRSIVLDLTQVSFLSSMGIRSILMSAKAVAAVQGAG
jgi:anti-anti-sigma regulatory factor